MPKFLILIFLVFAVVLPAAANPNFDLGPAVGKVAPTIGAPPDNTGTPRSLKSLAGPKGTVLFFFRAASWCPYCQAQLIDFNNGFGEIKRQGYGLAGISYEPPEKNAAFIAEHKIGFPLLSDLGSKIIDRYGLRDPQYKEGSRAYGVPQPIIFILDNSGVIKAKLYEDSFRKRPPVQLVIETLDKAN
jgi:peroxiredoxin